jgi:hypothetical protein
LFSVVFVQILIAEMSSEKMIQYSTKGSEEADQAYIGNTWLRA